MEGSDTSKKQCHPSCAAHWFCNTVESASHKARESNLTSPVSWVSQICLISDAPETGNVEKWTPLFISRSCEVGTERCLPHNSAPTQGLLRKPYS